MSKTITSLAALEDCVGKRSAAVDLKVIDHLDDGARRWIDATPLLFASFASGSAVAVTLGGGPPGFAGPVSVATLRLPAGMLDEPAQVRPGQGFGGLFLIPGIGETLRVNGRVLRADAQAIEIHVQECYIHCAKALIRSELWAAAPCATPPVSPEELLRACRFVALATADANGRADLSPKGDPAGGMLQVIDNAICFADRPGNRRTDSFRNLLAQPRLAMAAVLPGSSRIALLDGPAELLDDMSLRERFVVAGKRPHLVVRVDAGPPRLLDSAALARAQPWLVRARPPALDAAAIIVAHVKLNKARGLGASLVRSVLSVPGLAQKGLDADYKRNLY